MTIMEGCGLHVDGSVCDVQLRHQEEGRAGARGEGQPLVPLALFGGLALLAVLELRRLPNVKLTCIQLICIAQMTRLRVVMIHDMNIASSHVVAILQECLINSRHHSPLAK